ncbi:hypothetical protein TRIUR3_34936 [Triticum urartu]|uniref:Uncharacterized protein n=1 Tax=Triticum urartu TaxID=4572 RepID=M7ZEU8_TRIUA|nr:hypothetical protein TRIUR3_34936 [Triticum urartu]
MAPAGRLSVAAALLSCLCLHGLLGNSGQAFGQGPPLQATLTILIGQSSKQTGSLALDPTLANYCLSDVQQLLMSQGASDDLHSICSVHLSNATEGSCPVSTVDAFESVAGRSTLLTSAAARHARAL